MVKIASPADDDARPQPRVQQRLGVVRQTFQRFSTSIESEPLKNS